MIHFWPIQSEGSVGRVWEIFLALKNSGDASTFSSAVSVNVLSSPGGVGVGRGGTSP